MLLGCILPSGPALALGGGPVCTSHGAPYSAFCSCCPCFWSPSETPPPPTTQPHCASFQPQPIHAWEIRPDIRRDPGGTAGSWAALWRRAVVAVPFSGGLAKCGQVGESLEESPRHPPARPGESRMRRQQPGRGWREGEPPLLPLLKLATQCHHTGRSTPKLGLLTIHNAVSALQENSLP